MITFVKQAGGRKDPKQDRASRLNREAQARYAAKNREKLRIRNTELKRKIRARKNPWFTYYGHIKLVHAALSKMAAKRRIAIDPVKTFDNDDYAHCFKTWKHYLFHPFLTPTVDVYGSAFTGKSWRKKKIIDVNTNSEWRLKCDSLLTNQLHGYGDGPKKSNI